MLRRFAIVPTLFVLSLGGSATAQSGNKHFDPKGNPPSGNSFFRATGADAAEVDELTWRALMVVVVVGLVLWGVVAARLAGRDSGAAV